VAVAVAAVVALIGAIIAAPCLLVVHLRRHRGDDSIVCGFGQQSFLARTPMH
jgi:hypothetical protein